MEKVKVQISSCIKNTLCAHSWIKGCLYIYQDFRFNCMTCKSRTISAENAKLQDEDLASNLGINCEDTRVQVSQQESWDSKFPISSHKKMICNWIQSQSVIKTLVVAHRTRDAHTNLSAQLWPGTRSNVSRRDLLALCETSRINPINQIKKIDHLLLKCLFQISATDVWGQDWIPLLGV